MGNPAAPDLTDRVKDREATRSAGTAVEKKQKTIFDLIRDQHFEDGLPPGTITRDRFTRVAVTTVRQNPALAACKPASLLGALMISAQLGLEPGGPLGHAYLVPFGRECTFIIGYRGLIDLARRSGHVSSIYAEVVFEGDEFHQALGLHRDIVHIPTATEREDPKKITYVYAVARFRDEGAEPAFVVLTRAQVETFRARSKAKNNGPWVTDWTAMAMKTAVRRLSSWLPMSVETARALSADEKVIDRVDADADDFIDVEGEETETAKQGEGTDAASAEADGTEGAADASASVAASKGADGSGRQESGDGAAEPDPTRKGASADAGASTFDCDACEGGTRPPENGEPCSKCGGTGTLELETKTDAKKSGTKR